MLGPSVVGGLFFSCFPAVFVTVAVMFMLMLVTSIPLGNARRQILLESEDQFLTEPMIERELAKRHPGLYKLRIRMAAIMIGVLALVYVVSFITIVVIGSHVTVRW